MIPVGGIKACEADMNCFTISKYYKFIYDERMRFFQYNSERKRNVRKMKKYVRKTVIKALQEIDKFHVTMVQAPPGFGKTVAVRQYFKRSGEDHVWMDLRKKTIKELDTADIITQPYVILDHVMKEHMYTGILHGFLQKNIDRHNIDRDIVLIYADEVPSFFIL